LPNRHLTIDISSTDSGLPSLYYYCNNVSFVFVTLSIRHIPVWCPTRHAIRSTDVSKTFCNTSDSWWQTAGYFVNYSVWASNSG